MKPEEWSALFAGVAVLVSLVGVFIGMRANGRVDTANEHAKDSAEAARDSAGEAKRSADIAERSDARQTERNDVVWQCELNSALWTVTNIGVDDALEVVAVVTVNGEQHFQEAGTVPGHDGEIHFDLVEQIQAKAAKDSADMQRMSQNGVFFAASGRLTITTRVMWVTPAGASQRRVIGPEKVPSSGTRHPIS